MLKTAYLAIFDALRILYGRPDAKEPSGTGGAIG
jgi:hypothetical protein